MQNKCELKSYIADEAEKDKQALKHQLSIATTELKNFESRSAIWDELQQVQSSEKAKWANLTRSNFMPEDQAAAFYEAYMIQISTEKKLK